MERNFLGDNIVYNITKRDGTKLPRVGDSFFLWNQSKRCVIQNREHTQDLLGIFY